MKAKALKLADEVLAKDYPPRLEIAKELRRLYLENEQLKSRTWIDLTDAEINDCMSMSIQKTCRAVEAKLKEKNTWQDGDCKHCVNGCPACDARRQPNVLP